MNKIIFLCTAYALCFMPHIVAAAKILHEHTRPHTAPQQTLVLRPSTSTLTPRSYSVAKGLSLGALKTKINIAKNRLSLLEIDRIGNKAHDAQLHAALIELCELHQHLAIALETIADSKVEQAQKLYPMHPKSKSAKALSAQAGKLYQEIPILWNTAYRYIDKAVAMHPKKMQSKK